MNCVRAIFACFILNLVAELNVAQDQVLRRTALSPEASLACIELADGFEIDLIANEPQVIDPVDAAFDDRGRLWVVEMRGLSVSEERRADWPHSNFVRRRWRWAV